MNHSSVQKPNVVGLKCTILPLSNTSVQVPWLIAKINIIFKIAVKVIGARPFLNTDNRSMT